MVLFIHFSLLLVFFFLAGVIITALHVIHISHSFPTVFKHGPRGLFIHVQFLIMVLEVMVADDVEFSLVAINDWFFLFLFLNDDSHVLEVVFVELLVGDDVIVIEIGW